MFIYLDSCFIFLVVVVVVVVTVHTKRIHETGKNEKRNLHRKTISTCKCKMALCKKKRPHKFVTLIQVTVLTQQKF